MPCGEALVSQQRVVVGDGRFASSGAGQRVCQHRVTDRRAEGPDRRGQVGGVLLAARHDDAPRRARDDLGHSLQRVMGELGRGGDPGDERPAVGAAALVGGQVVGRDQRLAQGEVQMHRARSPGRSGPVRPARERADPAQPLRGQLVVADFEEPLDGAAVELDLVDRLPGADLAELGRPVGGEHEQRNPSLPRLDHRGRVVSGRRA